MASKRFRAKDVMTREVLCVRAGTNLREFEKLCLEKSIHGAPVVDEAGRLVGVITLTDVVYYHLTRADRPFHESDFYRAAELEKAFAGSGYQIEDYDIGLVGDMMTPVVHTAGPQTPIEEIARLMTEKRIHRVIIIEEDRVVGLVSAMDLLKVIAGTVRAVARPRTVPLTRSQEEA
jgi:CBS domain-containing protein